MFYIDRVVQPSHRKNGYIELFDFRVNRESALFVAMSFDGGDWKQQLDVLDRGISLSRNSEWDGSSDTLIPFLRVFFVGLCNLGIASSGPMAVSVGGVARCRERCLLGFRIGCFRVVSTEQTLWEETLHQQELATTDELPSETIRVLQIPTRHLPNATLVDTDLIWVHAEDFYSSPGPVLALSVFNCSVFESRDKGEPRVELSAIWHR